LRDGLSSPSAMTQLQIEQNIAAIGWELTADDLDEINSLTPLD
jgi:diketogulonate reductase-like aldo/keto reductase